MMIHSETVFSKAMGIALGLHVLVLLCISFTFSQPLSESRPAFIFLGAILQRHDVVNEDRGNAAVIHRTDFELRKPNPWIDPGAEKAKRKIGGAAKTQFKPAQPSVLESDAPTGPLQVDDLDLNLEPAPDTTLKLYRND